MLVSERVADVVVVVVVDNDLGGGASSSSSIITIIIIISVITAAAITMHRRRRASDGDVELCRRCKLTAVAVVVEVLIPCCFVPSSRGQQWGRLSGVGSCAAAANTIYTLDE